MEHIYFPLQFYRQNYSYMLHLVSLPIHLFPMTRFVFRMTPFYADPFQS